MLYIIFLTLNRNIRFISKAYTTLLVVFSLNIEKKNYYLFRFTDTMLSRKFNIVPRDKPLMIHGFPEGITVIYYRIQ